MLKINKIILENKFFLKILITYCLIIILGLSFTSYFITSRMINMLTESEAKFENEVIQKVKNYSEEKVQVINDIFAKMYYPYQLNNYSIIDLISPDKKLEINEVTRKYIISNLFQNICSANNNFILDMILVDYSKKDVFFTSNQLNRDLSLNFDFFFYDLFKKSKSGRTMNVIPNYLPKYINISVKNNFSILTFYINLFDVNSPKFDKELGTIAINVKPDFFKEGYKDSKNFKGKIMILNSEGLTIFDSSDELTGKQFPFKDFGAETIAELASNNKVLINKLSTKPIGFTFLNIVDKKIIAKEVQDLRNQVNKIIVIIIIFTLLISFFASRLFVKRIKTLVKYMRKVEAGRFDVIIPVGSNDEIGYLERSFNNMCEKIDEYIKSVYVFGMKTKTAELKALQAQINPHFMFNTLESIRITAQINKDYETAKMVHILGNMFRWNIKMKGMIVELKEEIDYINSYIELQKIRFENMFEVNFNLNSDLLKLGIPKLILQPIVENSIHYGFANMTEGGRIEIIGVLENDRLIIDVIDNGKGMGKEKLEEVSKEMQLGISEGDLYNIGLNNVHHRLRILFGELYGLELISKPQSGTTIRLTVPALTKEEMESYV